MTFYVCAFVNVPMMLVQARFFSSSPLLLMLTLVCMCVCARVRGVLLMLPCVRHRLSTIYDRPAD